MDTSNLLFQLQDKLISKYNKMKTDFSEEELEEMFGPGFVNQYARDGEGSDQDPSAVDTPYITHRRIGEAKNDQEKMDDQVDDMEDSVDSEVANAVGDEATGEEDVDAAKVADMGEEGADMGTDVGGDMGTMGDDMGGMGMEQEEPKTASEIGRIYELKKIYARLTSIEAYLGNESDQELIEIRNNVSKGIELFELVSSNFDSYKEKLDEIIVTYYKFLLEVYSLVKNFYSKRSKAGDK